jgi:Flp pilus assembly protein TadD
VSGDARSCNRTRDFMTRGFVKFLCAAIVAVVASGCAAKVPASVSAPQRPASSVGTPPAEDSLATFIEKFRKISAEARPVTARAQTLESQDAPLAQALAASIITPGPETYRRVAGEYRRLGVFDRSFQYLGRALAVNPHDGATFDALARLWRDSGLPALALGDAHRAVFFAPQSPATHNTLGTVFQALGRRAMARSEYERALLLDPTAAFALNNLCYGWILDGERPHAIAACSRAIEIAPDLPAARNNLALAYGLDGDVSRAEANFALAGDEAVARYNTGIMHLARRDYRAATQAFQQAYALKPQMSLAAARARQAATARDGE